MVCASRKRRFIILYAILVVVILFHGFELIFSNPLTAIITGKFSSPSSRISEQQQDTFVSSGTTKVEGAQHHSSLAYNELLFTNNEIENNRTFPRVKYDVNSSSVTEFVFPSVEERINYYMGSYWSNNEESSIINGLRKMDLPSSIECSPDLYQPLSKAILEVNEITTSNSSIVQKYFAKCNPFLVAMSNDTRPSALLIKLGDGAMEAQYPFIMKSREARRPNNSKKKKEAILLPLNFDRHFGEVLKLKETNATMIPWNQKSDVIVWRGSPTGPPGCARYGKNKRGNSCDRLELVRKYANVTRYGSTKMDIGFSNLAYVGPDLKREVEKYYKQKYDIPSMLQCKYLISVEGNDVASDLKWKLYSNSVVFMKPPTMVTWAMEDTLIPFYHYIPLADDFSDLFARLDWAKEHPEECQKIAHQSTRYMEALVTSDQAQIDENLILTSIFQSYQNRFGYILYEKCREKSSQNLYKSHKDSSVPNGSDTLYKLKSLLPYLYH